MKNVYLLLASMAVVGTSFAQNVPVKKQVNTNTLGASILRVDQQQSKFVKGSIEKKLNFANTVAKKGASTSLDTLSSHFNGTPILYTVTGGGFVAGHNSYGDVAKMQKFDPTFGVAASGTINQVILAFGAKAGNMASTLTVNIWDDNAGEPGNIIGTVTLAYSDIDTTSANGLTTVTFANPVSIPSNKIFYAGIKFTYSGSDAVGLFTTTNGDFPAAATHSWEEWSDGTFATLGDPTNWNLQAAYAIFPVVQLDSVIPPPQESVYYLEDFNNGIPSDYLIIDVDGQPVASQIAASFPRAWNAGIATTGGDSSALSTSWYTPAGQSDDWMITDTIIIPDSASIAFLGWDGLALDPDFPDGYEVYVSNTTQDIAGMLANAPVFSVLGENAEVTSRKVNISQFIGDTIFVGFRNNSDDMFILSIDNIKVFVPNPFDFAVTENMVEVGALGEYTRIPARHLPSGSSSVKVLVSNLGTTTPDSAVVYAQIKNGANVIYSDTVKITSGLPTPDDEIEVTMNKDFSLPNVAGTYNLVLTTSVEISDNEDITNNTLVTPIGTFTVSDTTYSRDNNAAGTTNLSIGGGLTGHLGMIYDINNSDTLTSVTAVLRGARQGRTISVSVWEANGATPDAAPLYTSKVYRASAAGTYNFPVSGGLDLTPGRYLISLDEKDSGLTVGTTTSIFTPQTVWIKSPGIAGGTWNPAEAFGANFARTFYIRPNFGNVVFVGLNNKKALNAEVNVYPNPNEGMFNVSISSGSISEYSVTITDMLGRVVESHTNLPNGEFSFDLSNQSNGMYFIRVQSGDAVSTHKVVLSK